MRKLTRDDGRLPFKERREAILDSIDKLLELRSMGYEKFVSDFWFVDSAALRLAAIGELVRPNSGHASPETIETFHAARNTLAHHYHAIQADEIWGLMGQIDGLRDEVAARAEPESMT